MAFWEYFRIFLIIFGIKYLLTYFYENLKSPVKIMQSILLDFFRSQDRKSLIEKYGEWAVITGSTEGIGKQYAKELAKKGLNIVLIAHMKDDLIKVSKEIETEFNVKVKWILADFTRDDIYNHIENELNGIPVGILVNNVGLMNKYPEEFANISQDEIWNMIVVNVAACTMMTRLIVKQMIDRRKGAIVNMSSMYNTAFGPLFGVYAATKVYVKYLSDALEWELEPYGITVQSVSPGVLPTSLTKASAAIHTKTMFTQNLEQFVKSAVFTLGKTNKTTGSWRFALQTAGLKLLPMELNSWTAMSLMKYWYKYKK